MAKSNRFRLYTELQDSYADSCDICEGRSYCDYDHYPTAHFQCLTCKAQFRHEPERFCGFCGIEFIGGTRKPHVDPEERLRKQTLRQARREVDLTETPIWKLSYTFFPDPRYVISEEAHFIKMTALKVAGRRQVRSREEALGISRELNAQEKDGRYFYWLEPSRPLPLP